MSGLVEAISVEAISIIDYNWKVLIGFIIGTTAHIDVLANTGMVLGANLCDFLK